MIDVVVYTQQSFEVAALMAQELGEKNEAEEYAEKALDLKERINSDWWVPSSNSFADFKSTKEEAIELVENAIIRADTLRKPWAVQELRGVKRQISSEPDEGKRGYVVHHNWVVNTPMEMGIAESEKAFAALETGSAYTNPFGVYVTGIDRDENVKSANWKSFSYVGAVMTLPTGVQAVAECKYGRPNQALRYIENIANSFSYALPGSMYEVSPDYGMIVQAWTIYGLAVPVVEYFFGIKPEAHNKKIAISPDFPEAWQNASLRKVKVGDNFISVNKTSDDQSTIYKVSVEKEGWSITFKPEGQPSKVTINKKERLLKESYILMEFDNDIIVNYE